MNRAAGIALAILFAAGCERPFLAPDPPPSKRVDQFLVLSGFGPTDTVTVGAEGYRVGLYHDFSPYDSLLILFDAQQLNDGALSGYLMVRVGPANYFPCALALAKVEVAVPVDCSLLAKPHSSALTFYATDPDGRYRLTHLRVMGWGS
jgi:hypothetical protein